MSTRQTPFVESASFAPCPDCMEGTLTWDPIEKESTCIVCE